jgi:hypothetical protein
MSRSSASGVTGSHERRCPIVSLMSRSFFLTTSGCAGTECFRALPQVVMLDSPQMGGIHVAPQGADLEIRALVVMPDDDEASGRDHLMCQQWRGRVQNNEIHTARCRAFELGRKMIELSRSRHRCEERRDVDVTRRSLLAPRYRSEDVGQTYVGARGENLTNRVDGIHGSDYSGQPRRSVRASSFQC